MDKTTAAKPELRKVWWDKNKAKTLLKTGVGQSLANYEMALDKAFKGNSPAEDEKPVQKAIGEAAKTMAAARAKANKTLHAETITALLNMEKLLVAEQKKSADRAKAGPPMLKAAAGGPPRVIFGMSIAKLVAADSKAMWITGIKGWDVSLEIDTNTFEILQKEDDGPFFQQRMVDEAKNVTVKAAQSIVQYISKVDAGSNTQPADKIDAARKNLETFAVDQVKKAQVELQKVPEAVFEDFKKKNKQYNSYRIKAGLKITQGTVSVALSAASLAGSGGASLAISIVGIIRGTADIAKQFYDLVIEADTVGKQLAKDVETLQKNYYDAQGQLQRSNQVQGEITGTILKTILGTNVPYLATLPKVTENFELWDNKVAGVVLNGAKLSGRVSRILEEMAKLEKKLANADGATAKRVYNDLLKTRDELDKVLTKTSTVMGQADRFEKNGPKLKEQIDALNNDNHPITKAFDVIVPFLANAGLSAAGNTLDFQSAKSAGDFVKTAYTTISDIQSIGQPALEAAIGK